MSKTHLLLSLSFLALFTFPRESQGGFPQIPKRDYNWVDEDTSTGRMYVAMDSGILANQDSLVSRLKEIAKKRTFDMGNGRPVKVALFSEMRFAHPKNKVSKKDKPDWAKSYLADFDTQSNLLILYPALPAKKKKVDLAKRSE